MQKDVTTVKIERAKGRGWVLKPYKFDYNKSQNLVSLKEEERGEEAGLKSRTDWHG